MGKKGDPYQGLLAQFKALTDDLKSVAKKIDEAGGPSGLLRDQITWLLARHKRANDLEQSITFVGQALKLEGTPDEILMAMVNRG